MPFVVTLSGSPNAKSRSSALLGLSARALVANGITVREYSLGDFAPEVLVRADHRDPQVLRFNQDVARADGLLLSTPVYKAAYSGGTKLLLDLLFERALERAVVLPVATGGSSAHMLVIDYAIRPVLAALGARHTVNGVYATDRDLVWKDGELEVALEVRQRLGRALTQFTEHLQRPAPAVLDLGALEPPAAGIPQSLVRHVG